MEAIIERGMRISIQCGLKGTVRAQTHSLYEDILLDIMIKNELIYTYCITKLPCSR